MIDFFISYTSADRPWAEWIAWELEAAGYTTLIQAWDFRPGTDWAVKMQEGTTEWSRILAVLSPHFFESKFTRAEWTSVFAKDPTGELGLLIPVRVTECEPPGLLRPRTYIDLVGLGEDAVRKRLLDGVKQGRAKPPNAPGFPGCAKPKPEFPLILAPEKTSVFSSSAVNSLRASSPLKKLRLALNGHGVALCLIGDRQKPGGQSGGDIRRY